MSKLLSYYILLAICHPCFAQSSSEIEKKMTEIKLDNKYVSGESLNANQEDAYENALADLLISINEIREKRGKALLTTSNILPIVKELRYAKGTSTISFQYVILSEMFELTPESHSNITAQNQKTALSSAESDKTDLKPQSVSHISTDGFTFIPNSAPQQPSSNGNNNLSNEIAEILCTQDNWIEIKGIIKQYKEIGKITSIGHSMNYLEVPEDACSILMDEFGGIISILSPKKGDIRINYKTNQEDNESNHSNCKFIVWYK